MHNRNLFSHSSGAWRSEIRPPARRGSGEQTAAFPLCPHLADRDMNSGPSSHKDATDPGRFSSDLGASLTFHSFSLSPSPSAVSLGERASAWNLARAHFSPWRDFCCRVCLFRLPDEEGSVPCPVLSHRLSPWPRLCPRCHEESSVVVWHRRTL